MVENFYEVAEIETIGRSTSFSGHPFFTRKVDEVEAHIAHRELG